MKLMLAGAALVAFATAAQAGTLQNGAWTPKECAAPGEAPTFNGKTPEAYNKSSKEVTAWQDKARAYAECVTTDGNADVKLIMDTANGQVSKINDTIKGQVAEATALVEELNKKSKRAR